MSLIVPRAAATLDYTNGGIYAFSTVANAWSYQSVPGLAPTDLVTVKGVYIIVQQVSSGLLLAYCATTNTWAAAPIRIPYTGAPQFITDGVIIPDLPSGRILTFRGMDATWNLYNLAPTPLQYYLGFSGNLLSVRAGTSGQVYTYYFPRGTWSSYSIGPTSPSDSLHIGNSVAVATCVATGTVHAYSAQRDAWTVQAAPGLSANDKPVACDWMGVIVVAASKTIFSFNAATGAWSAELMLGAGSLPAAAIAAEITVAASDFVTIAVPATQTLYTMKSGDAAWGVLAARGLTPRCKVLVG